MHKIVTPMRYLTSVGDRGFFTKRTGARPTISIKSDSLFILPTFEKINERNRDLLLIRVKLRSLKGSKFTVPDRYYRVAALLRITGFVANIEYLMQVRLIEVKSTADLSLALAGTKPKVKKTGSINQFRVIFSTEEDSPAGKRSAERAAAADATKDLLNLPNLYNQIKRPKGSPL